MSLQDTVNVVQPFSQSCAALWNSWLTKNQLQRENDLSQAIANAINAFLPPLTIQYVVMSPGDFGSASPSTWTLKINNSFCPQNGITYYNFVELCATVYHETRHAEQTYRCVQGLASGQLAMSGKAENEIIKDLSNIPGLAGGQALTRLKFGGNLMQNILANQNYAVPLLMEWTRVLNAVATHAYTNRASYATFLNLPKPAHFKRPSIRKTVEDWLMSMYKESGAHVRVFATHGPADDLGIRLPGDTYQPIFSMYETLPREYDAFKIEELLKDQLKTDIGHNFTLNQNQARTNVAVFGP